MIELPLDADDQTILQFLETWLILLEQGEYQEAYDLTGHPDNDPFTLDILQEQIFMNAQEYEQERIGLPSQDRFKAELPEMTAIIRPDLNAPPPDMSSGRMIGTAVSLVTQQHLESPDFLGEIEVDLPFDGEWSDLTAIFAMLNHEGQLVLYLKAFDVM